MKWILGFVRLVIFAIFMAGVILAYLFVSLFAGFSMDRAMRFRSWLTSVILPVSGVRYTTFGNTVLLEPTLIMSNHRSYLDPAIVLTKLKAKPVAKAEVSKWPLISNGLRLSGIIFVQRDQQSSRKLARKAILQCIQEGYSVYICPEGTTHIQPQTLEFRPATFHMAAKHQIPILPVAVEYKDKNDAFIGNDTFLPHFIRTFGKWRTVIHLHIGPILHGDDGEELLKQCKSWIDDSLAKSQAIFSDKDSNQLNKA